MMVALQNTPADAEPRAKCPRELPTLEPSRLPMVKPRVSLDATRRACLVTDRGESRVLGEVEIDGVGCAVRDGAESLGNPGHQGLGGLLTSVGDDCRGEPAGMAPLVAVSWNLLLWTLVVGEISGG